MPQREYTDHTADAVDSQFDASTTAAVQQQFLQQFVKQQFAKPVAGKRQQRKSAGQPLGCPGSG